jgi:hypothetical protein
MFRPYKAIIRHHINEEFYPTALFKIFFSRGLLLSFYILSRSAAIFRVCWCDLVRIVCLAFPVFTHSVLTFKTTIKVVPMHGGVEA